MSVSDLAVFEDAMHGSDVFGFSVCGIQAALVKLVLNMESIVLRRRLRSLAVGAALWCMRDDAVDVAAGKTNREV